MPATLGHTAAAKAFLCGAERGRMLALVIYIH